MKNSFWVLVQKSQYKTFPKKLITVKFKPLYCCNFMWNIRNFNALVFHKTWKTSFWGPFQATFGPIISKQNIFQKSHLRVNFQSLHYYNFMQKKIHALIFDKTLKTSFWGYSRQVILHQLVQNVWGLHMTQLRFNKNLLSCYNIEDMIILKISA